MENNFNLERSVSRVKATMEIEGFKINKNHIKRLRKIGKKELNSDEVISKYIRRVKRLTRNS